MGRLRAWSIADGLGPMILAGGLAELVPAAEVDAGDASVGDVFAEGSRELQEMTWFDRLPRGDADLEQEALLVEVDRIIAEADEALRGLRQSAELGLLVEALNASADAIRESSGEQRREHVANFRRQLAVIDLLLEQQDDDDGGGMVAMTHSVRVLAHDGDEDDEDEIPVYDRRRRAPEELYFEDLPYMTKICGACGEPMSDEGSRCESCGQG